MGKIGDMFLSAGSTSLNTLASSMGQLPAEIIMSNIQKNNQMELMNYQNALNRSNFTLQNSQNSPSAQIVRLREAGLNPALMYSGNGSTGMSSSISGVSSSGVGRGQPASVVVSPKEFTEMRNIEADTNKKNEETIALKTENLYLEDEKLLGLENKKYDLIVKASQAQKNSAEASAALKGIEQIDALIKESIERKKKLTEEIELVKAETALTQSKAGREKNKLDYEDYYKDVNRKKVPFEMRTSPAGVVSAGTRNIKTSIGRAVDHIKEKLGLKRDSTGLTRRQKADIEKMKSNWKKLQTYRKGEWINRQQWENAKENYRKKIIKLGYSKYIL